MFHSHIISHFLPQNLGFFTHTDTYTHSHTCSFTQIHMHVHTLTQSHICIYTYSHMVTYTYMLTHPQTLPYSYTCTKSFTNTYIHTHIHGCSDTLMVTHHIHTCMLPRMSFALGNTISLTLFPLHCSVGWGIGDGKGEWERVGETSKPACLNLFGLTISFHNNNTNNNRQIYTFPILINDTLFILICISYET